MKYFQKSISSDSLFEGLHIKFKTNLKKFSDHEHFLLCVCYINPHFTFKEKPQLKFINFQTEKVGDLIFVFSEKGLKGNNVK